MKKYSQHQKPADGESRKLNSPVICYPNDTIKIPYWDNYQQARKELEKIDEVIIPPRDAKCFDVKAGYFFRIESIDGPQVGDLNLFSANNYKEIEPSLEKLPILTHQPIDGGPYISSAMAVAYDEEFGRNLSFHRAMKIDNQHLVLRILDRHLKDYMQRGLKEFAYCNGVSVPVLLGSATSFGIEEDEMAVANALADSPVIEVGGHMVPQSEVVMICEFTGELHDEGSFLDLT